MCFYAPAQLVRDARDHGVEVRPVDVNASEWDCTLEYPGGGIEPRKRADPATARERHEDAKKKDKSTWGYDGPAVRLGFRQIKGMRSEHTQRIVEARKRHGGFSSVTEFHRLARLPVSAMRGLAEADAFSSLGLSRRQALWQV